MKTKFLVFLIAIAILGGAVFYNQTLTPQNAAPETPALPLTDGQREPLPDITLDLANGQKLRVLDMKQKVILIHFWAAWCDVCQTEFPDLVKYIASTRGNAALVSISMDDDYGASQKLLNKISRKSGFDLATPGLYWAWDKDKSLSVHNFNTVKVPETIIVDQSRRMVSKIVGVGPWREASAKLAQ